MKTEFGMRPRARSVSLRALAWPIFGLTLLPLAAQAGPVLPTGAKVVAGTAAVTTPSPTQLTVDQTSAKAIIDWQGFSVGSGGTVQFNNGTGATLNRVTGTSVSSIDGRLSATGSVYLINANGVVIGKSGVVDTGGTFVASALDVTNANFLAGGDLTFSGASAAAVVNYGKIGSLGGDVALIAARVDNEGAISAANGAAGLAAGYQVILHDGALDGGRFSVVAGGASTSVTNAGAIAAAEAELRANGGNIYALAGDTSGVIKATGVAAGGGKVELVAEGGTVTLGGTISARGANGAGGQIETSGSTVNIGSAYIDAGKGGSWLLDPNDLTIDQTAANTIAATLNAGTDVTQQTTASGTGGAGDIFVAPNVNLQWSTSAGLTLSAYRNISLGGNDFIASSAGGAVTLAADNTGTGVGTVSFGAGAAINTAGPVTIFYNPVSYTDAATQSTVNGGNPYTAFVASPNPNSDQLTAYMLVNNLNQLQAINSNLAGVYALSQNVDASATSGWNAGAGFIPIGGNTSGDTTSYFSGVFNGQGHTISNLYINYTATPTPTDSIGDTTAAVVGLFGGLAPTGSIANVSLTNANVTGASSMVVGALVGESLGAVSGASSTGVVSANIASTDSSGSNDVNAGGLIGQVGGGSVTNSWSSANVSAAGGASSGGLIGWAFNGATISDVHASGTVTIDSYDNDGGLIGTVTGYVNPYSKPKVSAPVTISNAYATGAVVGDGVTTYTGGFVGKIANSTVTNSYATGAVSQTQASDPDAGPNLLGGFAGYVKGSTISDSWASGSVVTVGDPAAAGYAGGFAGEIDAASSVNESYALGSVTAQGTNGAGAIGGFAGLNAGAITSVYSTGAVSGSIAGTGGLVGAGSGSVTTAYWDTQTSGQSTSDGGVGLTTAQFFTASNLPGFSFGAAPATSGWVIVDADGGFNNAGGAAGATRPMLLSEASTTISNVHQLQLMGLDPNATYTLAGAIDASATSGATASGLWTTAGFVPVGIDAITVFNGAFDGQGHTISGLSINRPNDQYLGLFGYVGLTGVVKNVTVTGSVSGSGVVGLIAGENDGTILNANASGTATGAAGGSGYVSLIAGYETGTLTGGFAAGSVSGPSNVGPIVGYFAGGAAPTLAHYDIDTTSINGGHSLTFGGLYDGQYQDWITHGQSLNPVNYFGAADANGVYSITDIADFKALLGFADVAGLKFKLTGNLDMSAAPNFFIPLLDGVTVDGAGYTVSNLNLTMAGATSVGLFGYVDGTVKNLTVSGSASGLSQVGLVAGYVDGPGSLIGDTASGTVSGTSYVGLLTGDAGGSLVNDNATGSVTGSLYYGGVAGYYGAGAVFSNTHYDVDTTSINGGHVLTTGGIYDAQYQDWISHGETLNIATYLGAPDANGYYSINNLTDLKNLLGFADIAGLKVKQTANIDLTAAPGLYIPLFNGAAYDGGGFAVSNVQVSVNDAKIGFFGIVNTGSITDLGVIGGSITGAHQVGGLVGYDVTGAITNSYATDAVHGGNYAGGLVGLTYGTLTNDYATGAVSGTTYLGGLVGALGDNGQQLGAINGGYATGAVTGTRYVGGLVGDDAGTISGAYALGAAHANTYAGGLIGFAEAESTTDQTYATGLVSGNNALGGLVGGSAGGAVTNSYWDTQTSGRASSAGGVGLTTAQFFTASNMPGFSFGATPGGSGWVIVDADGTLNNAGGAAGTVRPMLLSEYSTQISNLHQLQLMVLDPTANYALAQDINAAATNGASASGLWTTAGFLPVGIDANVTFTGSLDGQGHAISNLNINRPNDAYLGLFGYLDVGSNVHDLQVSGSVTGSGYVSLVAGFSGGSLTNVAASGAVTGNYYYGPVAGYYAAGTTLTNAHYDIDTTSINGGHAVTIGGLYDAQFQDWASHGGVLNIANYFGAPDANGYYSLTNLADLKNLLGFADQAGLKFKLTGDIDLASAPGFYIPLFDGAGFDGAGFAIENISVNQQNAKIGFLGYVQDAYITNLGVVNGGVGGKHMVGALTGYLYSGSISDSYSTAGVQGGNYAGGLVGLSYGQLTNDYATGNVSGTTIVGGLVGAVGDGASLGTVNGSYATGTVHGNYDVGGLAGDNAGAIATSYATGAVTGAQVSGGLVGYAETTSTIGQSYATGAVSGSVAIGGLVGDNAGAVSVAYALGSVSGSNTVGGLIGNSEAGDSVDQTYATGHVTGTTLTGGLVGFNGGAVTNSYWDTQTSGQATSPAGTGLTTAQFFDTANMPGLNFGSTTDGAGFVLIDADGTFNNAGGAPGAVRPMIIGEYTTQISNLHQLQLMALDPTANYTLVKDIDATATNGANAAGLWTTAGFLPIGIDDNVTFTGSLNGQGHQVESLTINRPNDAFVGLFGFLDVGSSVSNLNVSGSVTGSSYVSLIAGYSDGALTNASASGSVSGSAFYGPVAGFYAAGSTLTNAHYDIDTTSINGGHAVTIGGLYDAQFQDWASHQGVLNIANYYGAPDANGFYSITNLADLKNLLGFADQTGLKFKLTGNIDLASAPGFYVPMFDGAAFDGGGFTIANISVNQQNAKIGFLGFVQNADITNLGVVGGSITGRRMVGGVVGYQYAGGISNSFASDSVHGGNYAGGLVGLDYGALTNDYATGAVTGGTGVGGLVGYLGDGATVGTITGGYATGAVHGTYDVGGLVGDNAGAISQSYATGAVSGPQVIGGLVGWAETTSTVSQSYATGAVTGTTAAGGLIGDNAGSVSQAYAQGAVSGSGSVGGLIGYSEATATVDQTYSVGAVTGSTNTGGLIGANAGVLTNGYWDTQTSGYATSSGGIGLTTTQLQSQLPTGFDPSVWSQVAGSSFPYFTWQYANAPEVIGGTVYSGVGGTIVVGAHVSGFENGAAVGSATTGANGYYQILVAAHSIQNADLFTYLTSLSSQSTGSTAIAGGPGVAAPLGNALATNVTGSIGSMNIYEGYLYAQTSDTSMLAVHAALDHAVGANANAYMLYTQAGGFSPTANLWVNAAGAFTMDGVIHAQDIRFESGGDFTIAAGGQLFASGGGDAIIIAANGNFINDAGSAAVSNSNVDGRWLIYSQAANSAGAAPTGDVTGGLAGTSYYGDAYLNRGLVGAGFAAEPNAGDRFVYGYQPTLTITATTATSTYTGQTQTDGYTVAGLQNGDTASAAVQGALTTAAKDVGVYSFSSGLASDENYAISYGGGALTITPASLTLSGLSASGKVYDGTTYDDSITGSGQLSGVLGSDAGTVSLTGSASGAFADANAATNKSVSVVGLTLSGASAPDYVIQPLTLAATITPKAITPAFVGTIEKTYDGTKIAALTTSDTQLIGEVASDVANGTIGLTGNAAYGAKNAGTGLTVTASGVSLTGVNAADYVLTSKTFSTSSGVIDPAQVTAILTGTVTKVYNGTTAATLTAADYQLSGVISGDAVSLNDPTVGAYAGKDVGTGITVSVSGLALSGSAASNYTLTNTAVSSGIGVITPKTVTDSLTGSVAKTYDGTNVATLTSANYSVSGLINGDGVTLNDPTAGTYSSATAGARTVTVTGLALVGNTAGDYVLASPTVSGSVGLINPKTVTATFDANVEKTYDGTYSAVLSAADIQLTGEVAADAAAGGLAVKGTAVYSSKDVGSGLLVSVTGASLTGADAADYVLAAPTFSGAVGIIDPKALTATLGGSATKVYDGNLTATIAAGDYHLTGAITGDTVGLNDPTSGTYAQKDVGTGLAVTVTGVALTGASAGDYILTDPTVVGTIGKITPQTLVGGLVGPVTKVYDGTNTATLSNANYTLSGVVTGDTVALSDPTSGTYASANAGARSVTVTGVTLLNNAAGDYVLKSASLTANVGVITPKALTASLVGAVDKTYDTTTTATLAAANYDLSGGIIAGDSVSLNDPTKGVFAGKDVGTGLLVTVGGLKLTGSSAANYSLTAATVSGAVGEIDPKTVTATLSGNVSRVYNATTAAALSASNFKITGAYAADAITLSAPTTGTFDTKDVGTGKTITASGLTLNNNAAGDYVLASTTVTTATGTITPFTLSVSLAGTVSKVYDGTTIALMAPANYSLLTPFAGDDVSLNDPTSGTYAAKGSATVTTTGIKVTVTGLVLTGANASDYKLTTTTVSGNVGTIVQKPK